MISVVIIDDNKPIADRISATIPWASFGCEVVSIQYDGAAGRKAITEHRPDILIIDIMMPSLSGLEVVKLTKQIIPDAKVIFISAYDNFEYVRGALKLRAFEYLIKPFVQYDILKVVRNAANEIHAANAALKTKSGKRVAAKPLVERALNYIELHACENITLYELANSFGISGTHLSRLIRAKTGKRFVELFAAHRVNIAKSMLANTDIRIEEIAEQVGYKNYLTFYNVFCRMTGMAPREYKKSVTNR